MSQAGVPLYQEILKPGETKTWTAGEYETLIVTNTSSDEGSYTLVIGDNTENVSIRPGGKNQHDLEDEAGHITNTGTVDLNISLS